MKKISFAIIAITIIVLTSCDLLFPSSNEGLVTFDSNGGSYVNSQYNQDYISEPANPTYDGNIFGGWYLDSELTNQWDFDNDIIKGDMHLYAKWIPITYTITYHSNGATGGTKPDNQTKLYNQDLTLSLNSGNLEKPGFTFVGWNTKEDGSGTTYAGNSLYDINSSKNLYARWVASSYSVTYISNDETSGINPDNQTKIYNQDLTLSTNSGNLEKLGFSFGGWNTASNGSGFSYEESDSYSNNENLNLYARWLNNYTVSYNKNMAESGDVPENQTKIEGTNLILESNINNLVKSGFVFDGWNTSADGFGVGYNSLSSYSEDASVTLYAKWIISYTKLLSSNGKMNDKFGSSVSISGDNVVVGSANDSLDTAYVFTLTKGEWIQKAMLQSSDWALDHEDHFGESVSISGTNILIGAPYNNDNALDSGSAYIFKQSGDSWIEDKKLIANNGSSHDLFGSCVSINASTAVVGVPGDDNLSNITGSVYIFINKDNDWELQTKLLAPEDTGADGFFGSSVSVYGNNLVVGVPYDNDNGDNSGSVYIFTRTSNTWAYKTKLLAFDGNYDDLFGIAVSINDDTLVVGSSGNDLSKGCAYVFEKGDDGLWNHNSTKLVPKDASVNDLFGSSVSISGDNIIVGAPYDNGGDKNISGSAYIFTKSDDNWNETHKLLAHDGEVNDKFGMSVCIDSNTFIVGSYEDDNDNGTNSGSAYVRVIP